MELPPGTSRLILPWIPLLAVLIAFPFVHLLRKRLGGDPFDIDFRSSLLLATITSIVLWAGIRIAGAHPAFPAVSALAASWLCYLYLHHTSTFDRREDVWLSIGTVLLVGGSQIGMIFLARLLFGG